MKKLIILFIAISLYANSQTTPKMVNIWRVTPDTICPGDSIRVNYKFPQFNTSKDTFYLVPTVGGQPIIIGIYTQTFLASRPKEHWFPLGAGDSAFVVSIPTPTNLPIGAYSVMTNTPASSAFSVYVKHCACSVTSSISIASAGINYTFTSVSTGTTSSTTFEWDFGSGFQPGPAQVFQQFSPGQYTVSLIATTPVCKDTSSKVFTLDPPNTVGIEEFEKTLTPTYYEIYGGTIYLLRQEGKRPRKVIINK